MKTDHSYSDLHSVSCEYGPEPQNYVREIHSNIIFPFSVNFPKKSPCFGFLDWEFLSKFF